jgi:hypothetical protein
MRMGPVFGRGSHICAYLVTTVAACGNCHTPRDAAGKPMANMALAGGFEFDDGPNGLWSSAT